MPIELRLRRDLRLLHLALTVVTGGFAWLALRYNRRHTPSSIDADGLRTHGGASFRWRDLARVNGNDPRRSSVRVHHDEELALEFWANDPGERTRDTSGVITVQRSVRHVRFHPARYEGGRALSQQIVRFVASAARTSQTEHAQFAATSRPA